MVRVVPDMCGPSLSPTTGVRLRLRARERGQGRVDFLDVHYGEVRRRP